MADPVTRLWTPNSKHTVQQALDEAQNEHNEYELAQVIIIGEYRGSNLLVKPSRMTNPESLWLVTRAMNHITQVQFERDR